MQLAVDTYPLFIINKFIREDGQRENDWTTSKRTRKKNYQDLTRVPWPTHQNRIPQSSKTNHKKINIIL